jgi:hypothetical protein
MPRLTIAQRKALPDVDVETNNGPVFECLWCKHRFDMQKAYDRRHDAMFCPCCDAAYEPEGPHWRLDRKGMAALEHRRKANQCPDCHGRGRIERETRYSALYTATIRDRCETCNGEGYMPRQGAATHERKA